MGSTALLPPQNIVLWKAFRFVFIQTKVRESLESFAVHLVHAASGCIILRFVSRLLPTASTCAAPERVGPQRNLDSNTVSVPTLCTCFQPKGDISTLEGILHAASLEPDPPLVVAIVYDLRNRDCAAKASNGEICCHYDEDGST